MDVFGVAAMPEPIPSLAADADRFESWAVVELMGHVRMAGRISEEQRFGATLGRCDVPSGRKVCCPDCGGFGNGPDRAEGPEVVQDKCSVCQGGGQVEGFVTVYFGGSSVYRLTPVSEEVARAVARQSRVEPVHQWELPAPATEVGQDDGRDGEDQDSLDRRIHLVASDDFERYP